MLELRVHFLSDWRVGTGTASAGAVDDLARRDADGLPVVPGGTATGVLRDGCERAAAALDGGGTAWRGWVEHLFGSQPTVDATPARAPVSAALAVRTAALPARLAAHLRADDGQRRALFAVRPGVALDAGKQARTDFLRMQEVVRGGLELSGEVELADRHWSSAQRTTAHVLLALGAGEVSAIGGSRRRGLGRCVVEVGGLEPTAQAVLAAPDVPVPAPLPAPAPTPAATPATGPGWVDVDLAVVCLDPVLSTAVATDGTVRGEPAVPGSRVLPVVVARLRAAGLDVEPLVAHGLRCGPLVPEVDGMPGGPAPRCLVAPRGRAAGGPVVLRNRLRPADPAPGGQTLAPLRDRWVGPVRADGTVAVVHPELEVRVHNTVEDGVQRPTEAVGGLYAYEAIPAGTRLRGRLRLPAAAAAVAARALSGRWRLGRSQKGEYGRVDVVATASAPEPTPSLGDRATSTVLFGTDTVLLDGALAPVTTLDGVLAALGAALGVDVELAPAPPGGDAAALAVRRIDSWHARWGRPRPTLVAVAAGSVVVLRRRGGGLLPGEALRRLAEDGIGERRAEGLGVVEVDPPLLAAATRTAVRPSPAPGGTAPDGTRPDVTASGDPVLVGELRREALRRLVEHQAAALPRDALGELRAVPAAQLAQLRRRVAEDAADSTSGTRSAEAFLAGLDDAAVRGSRWPAGARSEARRLLAPGTVYDLLDVPAPDRVPGMERLAASRVLAHLTAGGRAARQGVRGGA